MTELHALVGPVITLLVAVVAIAAIVAALLDRSIGPLEWARRAVLALVVAQVAVGLALAVRGGAPREGIHWFYGAAVIVALLLPGALRPELPSRTRSAALAIGAVLAVIFAWRLGASG